MKMRWRGIGPVLNIMLKPRKSIAMHVIPIAKGIAALFLLILPPPSLCLHVCRLMVIVNSRFLECSQKRSCGNQLIHRRLSKTKSIYAAGQIRQSGRKTVRMCEPMRVCMCSFMCVYQGVSYVKIQVDIFNLTISNCFSVYLLHCLSLILSLSLFSLLSLFLLSLVGLNITLGCYLLT